MVHLVDLGAGRPALVGPGRVLPAAAAARITDADTVLRAARDEARTLVAQAVSEGVAIREAAHAEGLAAAETELQDRLIELAEASLNVVARTEERIVALGVQIAERIVGGLDQQELTARVALRSLKLAGRSSFIRLRVAPGAVDALRTRLEAETAGTLSSAAVEVVADPRVRDAGCVLETDAGLVEATIESQLAALRRGLHRSLGLEG